MDKYFAKIDINGVVENIIVASQSYVDSLSDATTYIETFYQADGLVDKRYNYAVIGGIYDISVNAFIPPQPFLSWTLNVSTFVWEAPTPMPTDGKSYRWDEGSLSWVEIIVPTT